MLDFNLEKIFFDVASKIAKEKSLDVDFVISSLSDKKLINILD